MRNILGIGGLLGHDANAAFISKSSIIAAAQEERFSRIKHDGSFPERAIQFCLASNNTPYREVSDVVFAEKPFQTMLASRTGRPGNAFTRWLGEVTPESWGGPYIHQARELFPSAKFHYAWHHLSHVAGAYVTSPFRRSAFLCVDGKGEDYSATIGIAEPAGMRILYEHSYENGLGLLYTLVTDYLGFHSFGSEYKVMGLAPYGRPDMVESLEQLIMSDPQGGTQLRFPAQFKHEIREALVDQVADLLKLPPREKDQPLEAVHLNLAASLQHLFEREVIRMAKFAKEVTDEHQLLFCGGCAQNCVTAGKLRRTGIFESIFNSPVGGDMGSAMGAAALLHQLETKTDQTLPSHGYYLGNEPGNIPEEADAHEISLEPSANLHHYVAEQLASGKIIGWIRGRMELGARALGARSILADPRPLDMQSAMNLKIKFRESFRPFAPAVLAEEAHRWFEINEAEESDFMNYTADLLPEHRREIPEDLEGIRDRLMFQRCAIPSVVHVDFSARLQTVRQSVHPDFHRLITAFNDITGIPMVINTSFNVSGQPIVSTAKEAWDCFVHTNMDLLVINDRIFRNPGVKTKEEKITWLDQFAKHS
ncbi:MAG: carbamoyltransferase C-terminal domain-containing protein [Verrucomicrobiota bacterium]